MVFGQCIVLSLYYGYKTSYSSPKAHGDENIYLLRYYLNQSKARRAPLTVYLGLSLSSKGPRVFNKYPKPSYINQFSQFRLTDIHGRCQDLHLKFLLAKKEIQIVSVIDVYFMPFP